MVYVDTSVLAAYYCPEARSGMAEKAILGCVRPAISLLVEVEFCSAVSRKVREGGLSRADAARIVAQFRLHVDGDCYERLPIDAMHYEVARDWVGRFVAPLRTLDALHLAICFGSGAVFLTSDVGLVKAARKFHIEVEYLS